jgi:hypothetical protein
MWNQSGSPYSISVNVSGWSLLFGAGERLQELLNPKAEWSGVAVTLPHWIEMAPVEAIGYLDGRDERGERVNLVDVANGFEWSKP